MQIRTRRMVHELILPRSGSSFAFGRWRMPVLRHNWHDHPEVELTVVDSGTGTRHVGDSVEAIVPGEVVLLGPGLPHTWHTLPVPGVMIGSIVVQFPADAMERAAELLPELGAIGPLLSASRRGLIAAGALARDLAGDLAALVASDEPLTRLSLLLRALARFGSGAACRPLASVAYVPPEASRDVAFMRLTRFVQERFREPLPARRVAAVAGVSAAGFSRYFKSHGDIGWHAYLTGLRIAEACRLLGGGDAPVTEVALSCGFANLANFNRRFRAVKGTTPTAFRRMARGEAPSPIWSDAR